MEPKIWRPSHKQWSHYIHLWSKAIEHYESYLNCPEKKKYFWHKIVLRALIRLQIIRESPKA